MATLDVILLLALSAIWGSSFIFIRWLAPLIGPVATADLRMLIAGIALVLFFLAARIRPGWRKNARHFLVIGLLNSAIPFVLYSAAALVLPAAMEAIFNSMSPMFGAVFAAVWLGEKLTARKAAGLVLGVAGVAVMSSLGGLRFDLGTALAVIACVLAPLCYGRPSASESAPRKCGRSRWPAAASSSADWRCFPSSRRRLLRLPRWMRAWG